jgi:cephalosporin-C deacetylase-like acetyl esterase
MVDFNPGGAADLDEAVQLRYEADGSRLPFTPTLKTKLDGIATGATANASDAALRDRATHTGTQAASTISDFNAAADARVAIGAASRGVVIALAAGAFNL